MMGYNSNQNCCVNRLHNKTDPSLIAEFKLCYLIGNWYYEIRQNSVKRRACAVPHFCYRVQLVSAAAYREINTLYCDNQTKRIHQCVGEMQSVTLRHMVPCYAGIPSLKLNWCTAAYWNEHYTISLLLFLFRFHQSSSSYSSSSLPPSSSSSSSSPHSLFLFVLSIVYSISITCSLLFSHSFFCVFLFPLSTPSICFLHFFSDVLFLVYCRHFNFSSGLLSHFLQIRLRCISFLSFPSFVLSLVLSLFAAIFLFLLVHLSCLGCRYFCWEYGEWNVNIKHALSHHEKCFFSEVWSSDFVKLRRLHSEMRKYCSTSNLCSQTQNSATRKIFQ